MQHAEDLFKRGINVLEDSSNWDWDESQQMTVSTSPTSFSVLIRFSQCSQASNEYKYICKTFVSNYVKKGLMYLVNAFSPQF